MKKPASLALRRNSSFLGSLEHGLGRVPVAEDFLGDVVGIDVQAVSRPLVFKQLGGGCRLARTVGTGYDA
jgi:hypothetical protein